MTEDSNERFQYDLDLIDKSYKEVVTILLSKYGAVRDNYYSEKSYNRFLNGEIKSISRGKYQRTFEGLYTHHIDENSLSNLSNPKYIGHFKYDFKYQKKDRLIYCDLFEHLILHALIFVETDGHYGGNGYDIFRGMILQWFTSNFYPKPEWMRASYKRACLAERQIIQILEKIEKFRMNGIMAKGNPQDDEMEKVWEAEFKAAHYIPTKEEKEQQKEQQWVEKYPLLVKKRLNFKTPRKKLLKIMYEIKYNKQYKTFGKFTISKLNNFRDDLFDELEQILDM